MQDFAHLFENLIDLDKPFRFSYKRLLLEALTPNWRQLWRDIAQPRGSEAWSRALGFISWWGQFAVGLAFGGLVAPAVIGKLGLIGTPVEGWSLILFAAAIATVFQVYGISTTLASAFSVRIFLRLLLAFAERVFPVKPAQAERWTSRLSRWLGAVPYLIAMAVLYAVGVVIGFCLTILWIIAIWVAVQLYVHRQSVGAQEITITFMGALALKLVVFPTLWGVVKSRAFRAFLDWLRGGWRRRHRR